MTSIEASARATGTIERAVNVLREATAIKGKVQTRGVGLALWVELRWQPPLWVHAALWTPFTIGTALLMLRPLKGVMVALNYRHRMADPDS